MVAIIIVAILLTITQSPIVYEGTITNCNVDPIPKIYESPRIKLNTTYTFRVIYTIEKIPSCQFTPSVSMSVRVWLIDNFGDYVPATVNSSNRIIDDKIVATLTGNTWTNHKELDVKIASNYGSVKYRVEIFLSPNQPPGDPIAIAEVNPNYPIIAIALFGAMIAILFAVQMKAKSFTQTVSTRERRVLRRC